MKIPTNKLQRHHCLFDTPFLLSYSAINRLFQCVSAGNVLDQEYAIELFDFGYEIFGSTAVLPIRGALAQRPDILHLFLGGSSVDVLMGHFKTLMVDPRISRIILDIDSPGGYVSPIAEFADMIFQARSQKEIISVINSLAASAAYWLASAAGNVLMNDKTAVAGSIGTYIAHIDISKMEEQEGIKTTEITAGKYKAVGSPHKPLSDTGKEVYQQQVDFYYAMFVEAIAKNRGLDISGLDAWAEGKLFIGEQAVKAGLADKIQSLSFFRQGVTMGDSQHHGTPLNPEITEAFLAANHPNLLASIKTQAYDEGKKLGIEQGQKAERARVMAIEKLEKSQAFEGFSAIFTKAKSEGLSEEETNKLLIREQVDRGVSLQGMKNDGTQAGSFTNAGDLDDAAHKAMLKDAVKRAEAAAGRRRK